ncbi:HU family DNA-binding protein [Candidatus Uhrbacteria bacterium]|nr:HU family DNA-binding protein [Candidatus Uhrbacteria bacterium]
MNKAELANKIAERVGITKKQAEDVLESFVEITIQTLKMGGEVVLAGFGAFSARQRKGRIGVHPRKPSEKITVPPVVVAKFKAGKNLKDALKGKA